MENPEIVSKTCNLINRENHFEQSILPENDLINLRLKKHQEKLEQQIAIMKSKIIKVNFIRMWKSFVFQI